MSRICPAGSRSPERRRSGSHYTPRSLTQPIVEAALARVLKKLGERPRPEQILALKVCDPAMGSGAFLMEACRQLGDALVTAWHVHNDAPPLPPDEDELLHARRIVAQRCLYGVDRNEMAADLGKTLARAKAPAVSARPGHGGQVYSDSPGRFVSATRTCSPCVWSALEQGRIGGVKARSPRVGSRASRGRLAYHLLAPVSQRATG